MLKLSIVLHVRNTSWLTIFFHPGERFDSREDFSQLGHSLRPLLLIALPFDLLLRQHLLEHLEEAPHRCRVDEEELVR